MFFKDELINQKFFSKVSFKGLLLIMIFQNPDIMSGRR